jgi:hypothetical protein
MNAAPLCKVNMEVLHVSSPPIWYLLHHRVLRIELLRFWRLTESYPKHYAILNLLDFQYIRQILLFSRCVHMRNMLKVSVTRQPQ